MKKALAWRKLFLLLVLILMFFFLSQFVALVAIFPFLEGDFQQIANFLENIVNYPEKRLFVLWMQAVNSTVLFVGTSLFFWWKYDREELKIVFQSPSYQTYAFAATLGIMVAYMPLSGMLVEWNKNIVFPDSLRELEEILQKTEKKLETLTLFMTDFANVGEFLVGLVVIAVIPAIGEEMLFRAALQRKIQAILNNEHAAIWISAFIFSVFHFQFYGLLPRMFLGALFGYLFVWSRSIWIAIFAHFLNNAITVMAMYFFKNALDKGQTLESATAFSLEAAFVSFLLVTVMLFHFYRKYQFQKS